MKYKIKKGTYVLLGQTQQEWQSFHTLKDVVYTDDDLVRATRSDVMFKLPENKLGWNYLLISKGKLFS